MDDSDTPDMPSGPEPIEIKLDGDGPFQLPLCTDLAGIAIGETFAILQFETSEGQRVDIPVPAGFLVELEQIAGEALRAMTGSPGHTVQ